MNAQILLETAKNHLEKYPHATGASIYNLLNQCVTRAELERLAKGPRLDHVFLCAVLAMALLGILYVGMK